MTSSYSGSFKCHAPHRTAGSSLSTTSRRKLRSPSLCSAAPQEQKKKTIQNHFGFPLALSPGFLSRYKTQNRSPGGLVPRHTRQPAYEAVPCTMSTILLSAANLTSMKLPDLETWRMIYLASERKREASSLVPISQPWRKIGFSPRLRGKIWEWPGDEAKKLLYFLYHH